jgi:hypothetical protein
MHECESALNRQGCFRGGSSGPILIVTYASRFMALVESSIVFTAYLIDLIS